MIKKSQMQKGSAHVVIIVILIIALIGVLGFVFWQNFIKKDDVTKPATTAVSDETTEKPITYKTYTTDIYDISFEYPDTWSLGNTVKSDDENDVSRSTTITTADGIDVDFKVGIRGLGGTCDAPATYSVIDTSSTKVPGDQTVNFSLTLQPNADGSFEGYYGLTDYYKTVGDVQVCPNTFYYVFSPTDNDYGLIKFNAKKSFADVDAANKYVTSDEYKAIRKMITSLTY